MAKAYYVYILASDSHELYVGVTNNIVRRLRQHRAATEPKRYTARHATARLIYCETSGDVRAAICREKQIKGWTRLRKLQLVEELNPEWKDLAEDWGL